MSQSRRTVAIDGYRLCRTARRTWLQRRARGCWLWLDAAEERGTAWYTHTFWALRTDAELELIDRHGAPRELLTAPDVVPVARPRDEGRQLELLGTDGAGTEGDAP